MGSGSGWGFGMPIGGAPGLQHPQARPNSSALTGFAQTISGSQNATPLDPSEFPSLSAAPSQPQNNTNAQTTWGNQNQNQRNTPVQRPQPGGGVTQGGPNQQHRLQSDDPFPSSSQFTNGLDDYRYGAQNAGQIGSSNQPQTTNIDEFPPLGRSSNGEIGQDRQGGMMHGTGFGQQQNGNGFGHSFPNAQSLLSRNNGFSNIGDGNRQGNIGDSITAPIGAGVENGSLSNPSFMRGGYADGQ
ncbi:MAG: hypothetical protein M1814_004335 [Vezdaea aestivalis]|nr:MAG: hypothetical protein M1814_004335 [Vezdaea aestivalis]